MTIDPTCIDDDKCLDLVIAHRPTDPRDQPFLGVLLAQDHDLLPPRFFLTDPGSVGLVSGDLGGDGDRPSDVVTANLDAGTVSILLNLGGAGEQGWQGFAPLSTCPSRPPRGRSPPPTSTPTAPSTSP